MIISWKIFLSPFRSQTNAYNGMTKVSYRIFLRLRGFPNFPQNDGLCISAAVTSNVSSHTRQLRIMSHHPKRNICLTEDCVKVAANILMTADLRVDPCDDFYEYSCGGWESLNPIPDGRSSWSMFEKLWEKNQASYLL
jgi:hypothetical protein